MLFRRLLAVLVLLSLGVPLASSLAESHKDNQDESVFSDRELKPYDGAEITEIRIIGLTRTSETAVRWLLGGTEGEKFESARWILGLTKLYNTVALYDISSHITDETENESERKISIDVYLKDKWTLLPFITIQGGGSVVNYGGGVFDTNFGGYFTNVSLGYAYLNQSATYDINLFQEWVGSTDFQAWLDISRNGFPIDLYSTDDTGLGSFTWARNQQEIMWGRRFPNIRSMIFLDFFNDEITTGAGTTGAQLFSGEQYRVRPSIIIGRDNLSNYLERGYELTITPSLANFFAGSESYYNFQTTFKQVWILPHETNFAYFINVGATTSVPFPYQYHLGGFDTVRGFSTTRFMGPYYLNANIEYRPLLAVTRISFLNLDQLAVQGVLFTDLGYIWADGNSPLGGASLALASAGLGLRFNFVRFAGCIIRLDLAQTITPSEGMGLSFGVGQFF
jgi:outer membrane protein assembly factor BamA